jgi:hypothetical protein
MAYIIDSSFLETLKPQTLNQRTSQDRTFVRFII